jgi:hypothetical protein
MKNEEIFLMYHNGLWFSRKKGEHFNYLQTYKNPPILPNELNSTKIKPVCLN